PRSCLHLVLSPFTASVYSFQRPVSTTATSRCVWPKGTPPVACTRSLTCSQVGHYCKSPSLRSASCPTSPLPLSHSCCGSLFRPLNAFKKKAPKDKHD